MINPVSKRVTKDDETVNVDGKIIAEARPET